MKVVFKNIWISVLALSVLTACASNRASSVAREGGTTSIELYRETTNGGTNHRRLEDIYRARHMLSAGSDPETYTRMAINELSVEFKKHPNPLIGIFIYPHLSTRDNAPIPGYMTSITLYDRDQYALPSELLAQGGQ